jgi:hypothetical protein
VFIFFAAPFSKPPANFLISPHCILKETFKYYPGETNISILLIKTWDLHLCIEGCQILCNVLSPEAFEFTWKYVRKKTINFFCKGLHFKYGMCILPACF